MVTPSYKLKIVHSPTRSAGATTGAAGVVAAAGAGAPATGGGAPGGGGTAAFITGLAVVAEKEIEFIKLHCNGSLKH